MVYISKKKRVEVFNKYDGHCAYCGHKLPERWQVDHKIPVWHFNQYRDTYPLDMDINSMDNLMPSCCSCNNYKSGNSLDSFRRMVEKQIDVLRRDKPTFRLAERFGLITCEPQQIEFYFEWHEKNIRA